MSIIQGNAHSGGQYQISRSLRFNSADSAYLNRTFGTSTNSAKWTFNRWVKRSALGARQSLFAAGSSGSSYANIEFKSDDTIQLLSENSALQFQLVTTQVFRDPSAWYNIHIIYDSANATSTDRIQLWVNGVRVTAFSTATYPSSPSNLFNTAIDHQIGVLGYGSTAYFSGYMTELVFVDGQALTPSSFGETDAQTGVWKPKAYSGSYGANGFFLKFADNSNTTATTLGKDSSGNGNNWTPNGFSVTAGAGNDSLVDTPTSYGTDTGVGGEVRGNYATWNPLISGDSATNGNLDVTNDTARSTHTLLNFDAYWEITSTGGTTTAGTVSSTGTTNTTTIANGKTYGFKLTAAGSLDYINITDAGSFTNITTGLTGQQFIYASAASATTGSLNTGQRAFAATAPSGFKALCTANLPTPTIGATSTTQANDYFDAELYTGNAGNSVTISGLEFQPDLVWLKSRSNADNHYLQDAVRGFGNSKSLSSNTTAVEGGNGGAAGSQNITFSTGSMTVSSSDFAYNGYTYVTWIWKANGAGSSNTDGTITSTVSASTTAGFSIVTYTGNGSANATVGHGLGVAPNMILVKARNSSTYAWNSYHSGLTAGYYIQLNTTSAQDNSVSIFPSGGVTSTVWNTGGDAIYNNGNGTTYVAYCFVAVAGYSAFGSYTGNGSTDGPFVYTGFRPRFVLIKNATTGGSGYNWLIYDTARDTYNATDDLLRPNLSDAEVTYASIDILSNGFKVRNNGNVENLNNNTIIYAAFAESPFKYSLAR